jgi:RNA polymerase sigma-70 factor (ECF subfamily)
VYGYLLRRTRDPSLAEELAQETFAKATRAFLGWRGGSPTAWLLAIARTTLVDEHRRGVRLVRLETDVPALTGDADVAIDVERTLAALPPQQERLLRLVYLDGFDHAEVAAMTGSTAGAVKTAVYRARRAFIDQYGGTTE